MELVERQRKPAPEEVLKSWAREWAKEGVAVDCQKLLPPKGFQVLPRRWVVDVIGCIEVSYPCEGTNVHRSEQPPYTLRTIFGSHIS